ncbi:MAG: oligopeptidase A, partial [Gammaproteobacteria bacterium]
MSVTPANPLLEPRGLPTFSKIRPEHVRPAIEHLIDDGRRAISALLADLGEGRWDDLLPPLEEIDDRLDRAWSPVSHLHSVADNPELRAAYNACLPLLTDFANEMGQNQELYRAFQKIREADDFAHLDPAQRSVVGNALRDFRLAGVHLDGKQKEQYRDSSRQLAEPASRVEENVLDATQAWKKH